MVGIPNPCIGRGGSLERCDPTTCKAVEQNAWPVLRTEIGVARICLENTE